MSQLKRVVATGLAALLATLLTAAAASGGGSQDWSRTQHLADSGGGMPGKHITLADTGGGMPGKP